MNDEKKGMLAAGVAYTIFGLSYLFSKMALGVAEPMILLLARFSVTLVVLNLLVATRVLKLNLKGKNLMGPILLGILQPCLYFVLENYGLKYTTTSFTGLMSSISPVLITVVGAITIRERPNARQWLCIGVSVAGVLLVSLGASSGENTALGIVCLLGSYATGAFYAILVRKFSKVFSAFELTYVMFTLGFIFFAVLTFFQYGTGAVSAVAEAFTHGDFVVSVLYLGGLSSVGAYMLANYSIARLTVARASIFNCLATVVSVLSGVIIMKDPFTWVSLLSCVLILTGVWGVNRFADPEIIS